MLMTLLTTIAGLGLGAAMGYFGRCTSGACPLTATPLRGALVGGAIGCLMGLASFSNAKASDMETALVPQIEDENDFAARVVDSDLPVLVDFYADWCGPCRQLSPIIEQVADAYQGRLLVVKVNVDDNRELARQHGVRAIPRLAIFKQGKQADATVGAMAKEDLVKWINKTLQPVE